MEGEMSAVSEMGGGSVHGGNVRSLLTTFVRVFGSICDTKRRRFSLRDSSLVCYGLITFRAIHLTQLGLLSGTALYKVRLNK